VASPSGLHLGLDGAGPDVRQLLLRSADGSYALVLWRGVSVWDPANRADLYPAADHIDVVLGDRIALARRFDPVASDAEQQRWEDPSRIPVDVAGAPVVLRLNPPGVGVGGAGDPDRRAAKSPVGCASAMSTRKRTRCCRAARHRAHAHHRAKRPRAHSHRRAHHRRRAKASWAPACVSSKRG
jgi:hypothetical protein